MGLHDPNLNIWLRSKALSRPFWALYEKFIGLTNLPSVENKSSVVHDCQYVYDENDEDSDYSDDLDDQDEYWYDGEDEEEDEDEYFQYDEYNGLEGIGNNDDDDDGDDESVDPEYLEFRKITKQHQAERKRLKQMELKGKPKNDEPEEYYIDISQVNTLVESNLVEAPSIGGESSGQRQRDEKLIKLYGSQEAFEKIRSMEMNIDEHFNKKCLELHPKFWPTVPLNPKPYLNPLNDE